MYSLIRITAVRPGALTVLRDVDGETEREARAKIRGVIAEWKADPSKALTDASPVFFSVLTRTPITLEGTTVGALLAPEPYDPAAITDAAVNVARTANENRAELIRARDAAPDEDVETAIDEILSAIDAWKRETEAFLGALRSGSVR